MSSISEGPISFRPRGPAQFSCPVLWNSRYTTSLTTQITFGWRSPKYSDPAVREVYEVSTDGLLIHCYVNILHPQGFEKFAVVSQPNASLLDFYPWLQRLPDWVVPMKRYAKALHKDEKALYISYMDRCREQIKAGTARPCFCVDMLRIQEEKGVPDELACYISGLCFFSGDLLYVPLIVFILLGTLLEAGSDTASLLSSRENRTRFR
jgi:hypothetical protein